MAWFRINLSEEQQQTVNEERDAHPAPHVRRKMLVLWLLHCKCTREKAAEVAGLGRATVQRYVAAFRDGGLDGLRQWDVVGPVSALAVHREVMRKSFEEKPARSVAEAGERIHELTGVRRGSTQVRKFISDMGMKWRRVRAVPVPPKKAWANTSPSSAASWTPN